MSILVTDKWMTRGQLTPVGVYASVAIAPPREPPLKAVEADPRVRMFPSSLCFPRGLWRAGRLKLSSILPTSCQNKEDFPGMEPFHALPSWKSYCPLFLLVSPKGPRIYICSVLCSILCLSGSRSPLRVLPGHHLGAQGSDFLPAVNSATVHCSKGLKLS